MFAPLYKIRQMIHSSAPAIGFANWRRENDSGWRWEINVAINPYQLACDLIKDYQGQFGKENVTFGQPFDETNMKPGGIPTVFGLYIRDIDALMAHAMLELEDDKKIQEWIGK